MNMTCNNNEQNNRYHSFMTDKDHLSLHDIVDKVRNQKEFNLKKQKKKLDGIEYSQIFTKSADVSIFITVICLIRHSK